MKSVIRIVLMTAGLAVATMPGVRAADEAGSTGDAKAPVAAGPGRAERRAERLGGREQLGQFLAERLGLSTEQTEKVRTIREQQMDDLRAVRDDAALAPDQKREKVQAVNQQANQKIRALLTPEQQPKFDQLVSEMQERGRDFAGGRGPGGPGGERPERAQEMARRMAEYVGLSQDQIAKVKVIREKQQADIQVVRNDAALAPDQQREKAREIRQNANKEIRALLTPEQQTKFDQFLSEMQNRRPERGGPGGPPPPDGPPAVPPPPGGA
jgi:protein CpxP